MMAALFASDGGLWRPSHELSLVMTRGGTLYNRIIYRLAPAVHISASGKSVVVLLSNMTAEDAAAVLTAFAAAGAASGGSMAMAVNSAVAAIQAQPGATDQEKLAAWSQAAR